HDGSPHAVHARVRWEDDVMVADVGGRTAANAAARPSGSLLFSVGGEGDYSLIVDGAAAGTSVGGGHWVGFPPPARGFRAPPAVSDPSSPCTADCVQLLPAVSKPT